MIISRSSGSVSGFTLVELMIVIFLIGLFSAVAVPYLLPAIVFSEHEGAARHLSNFGRAAMAEAELFREDITVRFDLDEQEYYAVHMVFPEEEGAGQDEVDQLALLSQYRADPSFSMDAFEEGLAKSRTGQSSGSLNLPDGFDDEAANSQIAQSFAEFTRSRLLAQAENVKHEAGFLDEVGPLFDPEDPFTLSLSGMEEQELKDPMLERSRMPESVRMESVITDGVVESSGVVEIKLSALGLSSKVGFYLVNEDGDYYTVIWDPVLSETEVYPDRVDIE